jgi:hypothetical protein
MASDDAPVAGGVAEVGSVAGAGDKGVMDGDASKAMWSGEERHEVDATVVGTEGGS